MTLSRRKVAAYAAEQLHAGASVTHLARQLAAYIVERGKTEEVDLLVHDITSALSRNHGIATMHITSAHPLKTALKETTVDYVRKAEGAHEAIVMDETMDPELIGGVKVETAHGVFDASVRQQLNDIRTRGDI